MIYTRFGTEVKIVGIDNQKMILKNDIFVKCELPEYELNRTYHISELKATNGLTEIMSEIEKLTK